MKWFKKILAVLLLVLWAPTTSHCLIEATGVLPEFLCCAEACTPDGGTTDGDTCQSLESASYRVDERASLVATPFFAIIFSEIFDSLALADDGQVASVALHVSAPEFPVTWQFTFRTALPPRAPSFVS